MLLLIQFRAFREFIVQLFFGMENLSTSFRTEHTRIINSL